jgi:ankyrin repeat protein
MERKFVGEVQALLKVRNQLFAGKKDITIPTSPATLLHLLADIGQVDSTRVLLDSKWNPNIENDFGMTPFHFASINGHSDTVNILLRAGADVNRVTQTGWTALHMASGSGHLKIVQQLLREKATLNVQSTDGSTPLHLAAKGGPSQPSENVAGGECRYFRTR